ncbi:hypothetical protein D3OALGA1CA_5169 [Olavius algarvensis associated proteobacterium Delta 3]|nr:hypothetical protein D3OALGB2SA_2721 [Olavius algarvensis associated proteobacterium Delta 3]CAB5162916.1 hypothetical protein D3OALGA1CA_5169 [Olavius algarvensis associated proteobacterium Delta 3]
MGKALRDEAVVRLPRISNNAGQGGLRLARRVKSFQAVRPFFNVTNYIAALCISIYLKAPILFLLKHLLKRFHAMFGIKPCEQLVSQPKTEAKWPPFLEGLPPAKEGKPNSRIIPLLHSCRSGSPLSDRWNGGASSLQSLRQNAGEQFRRKGLPPNAGGSPALFHEQDLCQGWCRTQQIINILFSLH